MLSEKCARVLVGEADRLWQPEAAACHGQAHCRLQAANEREAYKVGP
jgi:hypothetical protein